MASLQSSLEVEDALVRAGTKLGMKGFLLRMVAAELPDNPWLRDLQCEAQDAGVVARASHLCGAACTGDPEACLTAFKVEDAVTKRFGRPYTIRALRVQGDGIEVHLAGEPLEAQPEPQATSALTRG